MPSIPSLRPSSLRAMFVLLIGTSLIAGPVGASAAPPSDVPAAEYWTAARMANAIPRDLVVDEQGRGYLRHPNGSLEPYGQSTAASTPTVRAVPTPLAKPDGSGNGGGGGGGGTTDTIGPEISEWAPVAGSTIGASHTFSAKVVDAGSGVKSVTFVITYPSGSTGSFSAVAGTDDTWSTTLQGFTGGTWSWAIIAKDNAKKGGNTAEEGPIPFTVATGGDGGTGGETDGSTVVANSEWDGGDIQRAAGRLYFEMRTNGPRYAGYVCSGTVATDGTDGISVIITAAHCVYDDANKEFARNVLFIPDQAGTSSTGTNTVCTDDPYGCWEPSHGVVDDDWAGRTWPDNIPWDYAYYVVPDADAHLGTTTDAGEALDEVVGSLPVQFLPEAEQSAYTHALGYSYSEDPKFMYCAQDLGTNGQYGGLWLGDCELSGGASGGPWVQPMDTGHGTGPIIGVNSYGYSNQPGMGAAALTGSASCLFDAAKGGTPSTERGLIPPAC